MKTEVKKTKESQQVLLETVLILISIRDIY